MSIFSAYKVCKNSSSGASTALFQQQLLLMSMKTLGGSTNPRQRFIDDLSKAVNDAQSHRDKVIMRLDANSVASEDKDGLDKLIREGGL